MPQNWNPRGRDAPELFAHYLAMQPDCPRVPGQEFVPRLTWGLFQLSGWNYDGGQVPDRPRKVGGRMKGSLYERWKPYARAWDKLGSWLQGDTCWMPPSDWPLEVQAVMPPEVTPLAFAIAVMPTDALVRISSPMYNCSPTVAYGFAALGAYANGWVTTAKDAQKMAIAAEWMQAQWPFILWLNNPMLEVLEMPEYPGSKQLPRHRVMHYRARLLEDPLACPELALKALPEYARDMEFLMSLPRRPFNAFRSSRRPTLVPVAKELFGFERREDWIDFRPKTS